MAAFVQESELVSFFIYRPELGRKEGTEHLKILYYRPEEEVLNRKVRNIGLCEALVNFTKMFSGEKPCESVHTQRLRQVFYEPETGIWMVMTVSIPWAEVLNNGEKTIEYYDYHVQECIHTWCANALYQYYEDFKDPILQAALIRAYCMFKLFNGSYTNIMKQFGVDELRKRVEKFFSRYLLTVEVSKLDVFSVFQGIQFLPLDKYMYLKVYCFVNLVETTFRNIQRSVFLYGDQLVWSGLEQEDIKIFYQYLLSWLFPSYFGSTDHVTASLAPHTQPPPPPHTGGPAGASHTGSFLIGQSAGAADQGTSKSPWVYITVDGVLQSCRLFVYNAGNVTMCFFVQWEKGASAEDFCKRLGTFLGPRLAQTSREIGEFHSGRAKAQGVDQQYRFLYFNEMNLAVKSPLLSRRIAISPDAMRLLTEVNTEYDRIEEGETIMRTLSDYWVVCRKSGHRRFFVVLNQKSANFAEITEDVRRLCQKEFTNIFFLD